MPWTGSQIVTLGPERWCLRGGAFLLLIGYHSLLSCPWLTLSSCRLWATVSFARLVGWCRTCRTSSASHSPGERPSVPRNQLGPSSSISYTRGFVFFFFLFLFLALMRLSQFEDRFMYGEALYKLNNRAWALHWSTAVGCRKEQNGGPLPRITGKGSEGNTFASGTHSGCPLKKNSSHL